MSNRPQSRRSAWWGRRAIAIGFVKGWLAASGCGGDDSQPNAAPDLAASSNPTDRTAPRLSIEVAGRPELCPRTPPACGGEIAGSWVLAQACYDSAKLYVRNPCLSLQQRRERASGGIYIRTDGSIESTVYGEAIDTLLASSACYSDCAAIAFDRGTSVCQRATGSAGCVCTLSFVSSYERVFPDAIEQKLRAGEYCVTGDQLLVGDPDLDSEVALVFQRTPEPPEDGLPSLMGSEVHYSTHCCSGAPGESNRTSERLTAEVTPAVEFPAFGNYGREANVRQIPGSLDVEARRVTVTFRRTATLATGGLNAFRLVFQAGRFQRIRGARLAPDSTAPGLNVVVSFEDRTLLINTSGGTVVDADAYAVDLQLE